MMRIINFDQKIALKFAEIQAELMRKGLSIAKFDGAIAATALVYGATFVTTDEDFRRVKNLKLLFPKVKTS